MHTLSGRRFEIGTNFAPTVKDIAIGLARIPRWAGATVRPWSVLQHSLAAGALVSRIGGPILHLAALTHDMEEMATGDIPAPYKTAQQRELGERLRAWMYSEVFTLPSPDDRTAEQVHEVDGQLKLAELLALCHPRAWGDPYFGEFVTLFIDDLTNVDREAEPEVMAAIDAVWGLIDMPEREQIFVFTDQVEALLASRELQALVGKA